DRCLRLWQADTTVYAKQLKCSSDPNRPTTQTCQHLASTRRLRTRYVDLSFDRSLASLYKSPTQQARVLTESWVGSRIFCPSCGRDSLNRHPNNTPVGDFFCSGCNEQFELKAKRSAFGAKIVDGEYHAMVRRLQSDQVPSLFGL